MGGIVFAAGEGTRMRPFTETKPKPMLKVGDEPMLTRCLRILLDLGSDRLIVVVGYRAETVTAYYGNLFSGVPIEYVSQENQEGMAHALLATADRIRDDMLLIDGDNVFDCDLSPLVSRHRDPDVDGTLLVEQDSPEAARSKAICRFDDGRPRDIEKEPADPPDPSYVAAGFQTATPALVEAAGRSNAPRGASTRWPRRSGERWMRENGSSASSARAGT